jgi:hypothetical protein
MKLMTVLTNTTRDTDTAATPVVRKKFQLHCIYLNQKRHQDRATLPSPERNVRRPYPIKTVAVRRIGIIAESSSHPEVKDPSRRTDGLVSLDGKEPLIDLRRSRGLFD